MRPLPRRAPFLLVVALLAGPSGQALAADEEPTPFWLAPEGDKPAVAPPPRKKVRRPKPKPVEDEPSDLLPPERPKEKPRRARRKPETVKKQDQRKRTAEDEASAVLEQIDPPRKRKKKAAPVQGASGGPVPEPELPAIVAPPPSTLARPKLEEPPPGRPAPSAQPPARPPEEELLVQPSRARPVLVPASPAPVVQQAPPPPAPILTPPPRPPEPAPLAREPVAQPPAARAPPAPAAELRPPVVAPGPREEAAATQGRAIAELEQPAELTARRSPSTELTVGAFAGLWSSNAAVGGRRFDLVYGARLSAELFGGFSAELSVARSGVNTGNPYAAASTSRMLLGAHGGYWLYDQGGLLAVQAGGGLAASLSSTSYSLQDPGLEPQALGSGSVWKLAPEISASLRLHPLRFLELRLDAAAYYRDGRLELLPSLGAGAWVAF